MIFDISIAALRNIVSLIHPIGEIIDAVLISYGVYVGMSDDDVFEVAYHLVKGHKIEAIKVLRACVETSDSGTLKPCKVACDVVQTYLEKY